MFFGTSKDVTLGPTAIMSLLTISIIDPDNQLDPYERVPLAILLTLLSGLVQFALGILNLGFLIDFIPRPVISGFTSAAAITIAFGQVKSLFGVTVKVRRQFIYCVYDTIKAVVNMNWMPWDFVLGLFCIGLVLFLRYFKTHNESIQENLRKKYAKLSWFQIIAHKFLWVLCTGRNAVIIFIGGLIGLSIVEYNGGFYNLPMTLVKYETEGELPDFIVPNVTISNIKTLGAGIVSAPLIGFLESIAISKAFARQNMYIINPTQELIALGQQKQKYVVFLLNW
jgi:sodium-independent sulfate anion transporter 11